VTLDLNSLSTRDSIGLLVRKVQIRLIEKILESFETSYKEHHMIKFHPKIYQIDLTAKSKFSVKLESNYKTIDIDKTLTIDQIMRSNAQTRGHNTLNLVLDYRLYQQKP